MRPDSENIESFYSLSCSLSLFLLLFSPSRAQQDNFHVCRKTLHVTIQTKGCTYDNRRTIPLFCSSGTTRHGERAGDRSPPYLPRRQPFQSGSACSLMYGKIKEYDFVSISQRANLTEEFLKPLNSYLSVKLVHIVRTVLRLTAQSARSVLSYSLLSRFVSICRDSSGSIYAPTAEVISSPRPFSSLFQLSLKSRCLSRQIILDRRTANYF